MTGMASDEDLMRRLAGGDEGALEELMRRWQGPLWCFVERMIGRRDRADELYQEFWTRLYLYRRRYRPDRPFRSWVFAIALNCCRSAISRGMRRPAPRSLDSPDEPARQLAADDPAPLDALVAAERAGELHQAIAALPDAQRAVVLLHLLCDPDYGRIAAILGKRPGTVRSLMHHALGRLRAVLSRIAAAEDRQVDHERQPC